MWIHDKINVEEILKEVYGVINVKLISLKSVSKINYKTTGTCKILYQFLHAPALTRIAFIHFAKKNVKLMQIGDLNDFCLPFQMWARANGFKAPQIWRTIENKVLWEYKDYHGYIEFNQAGVTVANLSQEQLSMLGNWMGALHRISGSFKNHNERMIHLNLEMIHLRWSETLLPLISDSNINETDDRFFLHKWLNKEENMKLISNLNDELREGSKALDNKYKIHIHGDLNADNLHWNKDYNKIHGWLDWKGSRFDFPIADLIVPLRKLVIGEGGIDTQFTEERLKSFADGYRESFGNIPDDQLRMLVPALLISDISFFTWQMKEPIYINRAMTRVKDFAGILDRRSLIEKAFSI